MSSSVLHDNSTNAGLEYLMDLTAIDLCKLIQSGKATPLTVISQCFSRIHRLNPSLNALVVLCEERAMKEARKQTHLIERALIDLGQQFENENCDSNSKTYIDACSNKVINIVGPLAGIPVAVKDLEDAEGLPTSYGGKLWRNNIAKYDSPQVARLRAAGAIIIGKTNVPIFGSTIISKNLLYGTTRNPWDLRLTPGGSSGGSAACIAARLVPLVTAADGGGSIRCPATFVGAFGLKPSHGRIPMTECEQMGMLPLNKFCHFGPITRCVEDTALFLDVVCGYHSSDPQSLPAPPYRYSNLLKEHIPSKNIKIHFSPTLGYVSQINTEVIYQARRALNVFRRLGYTVIEEHSTDKNHNDENDINKVALIDLGIDWAKLSSTEEHMRLKDVIKGHEGDLERGFINGIKRFGTTMDFNQMAESLRRSHILNRQLAKIFHDIDILVTPTMPMTAFSAKGPIPSSPHKKSMKNKNSTPSFSSPMHAVGFLYPFNFSGHPACTLRSGFDAEGMPCGIQLIAPRHRDDILLQVAYQYQQESKPFNIWPCAPFKGEHIVLKKKKKSNL